MNSSAAADITDPRPANRDARIIGLIGWAHFTSHFFQMTLPFLVPVLKDVFNVSYTELGLMVTVFYGVSGIGQPIAGFMVDRLGARAMLIGGMILLGASMLAISLAPSYWLIVALMVPLGIGNCVFHPADFSILSASVSPRRMGRAFSIHAFGGTMGFVLGPLTMLGLSALVGWRYAFAMLACYGLIAALVVHAQRAALNEDRAGAVAKHASGGGALPGNTGSILSLVLSAPMLLCFAYFLCLAIAGTALQSFFAPTMEEMHGIPIAAGLSALTAYLTGSALGILAGGYTADRYRRHELLVALGLVCAATLIVAGGLTAASFVQLAAFLAVAGFMAGTASAARDMLVRSATPKGASGKVFGFVYAGLDLGSTIAPMIAGFLLDHHYPVAVIFLVAGGQLLAMSTAFGLGRRRQRAATLAPAE